MLAPPSLFRPVAVPRILDRLVHLPAAHAWMLVLLLADLVAISDLATGPELWFGPVYLLVICLATWSRGWKAGQATGIGCMALTFALNGASLYPYGSTELAWNLAARFAAVSAIVVVIAGVRRAFVREWWLARTDPLTGALNRQAFFDLGEALAASPRWRLLLYADLDGLKEVNDGHGHGVGDACLKAYAAAVRQAIRNSDLFARVGGDEFLVFMSVKNEAAARSVAARLHAAMNATPAESGIHLQCSVGALLVPPGSLSVDELVKQADSLMYQAKLRGAGLELRLAVNTSEAVGPGRARTRPRPPAPLAPVGLKPITERRETPGAVRIH